MTNEGSSWWRSRHREDEPGSRFLAAPRDLPDAPPPPELRPDFRARADLGGESEHGRGPQPEEKPTGWGHRLLMLACCIPMLIVVIALVASGVAGAGAVIFALLCVAMMAAMMFMMPGDHKH